jgi:AraC-like DNA-binding protein
LGDALTASERIAAGFGIEAARTLIVKPLQHAQLSIVHLDRVYEDNDDPVLLPPDTAFLVMLYLIDVQHFDIWPDRPPAPIKTYNKGSICLINLQNGASISVRGRLEALAFHIPSAHLAELTKDAGEPPIDSLEICRGIDDPVICNLGAALLPMFDLPDEVKDILLPHVGLAFSAHVAHRYGQSPIQSLSDTGKLTPQQETRIKTYITANLSRQIDLKQIADASGFDKHQLHDRFMATTGQSIQEWILECQMNRAKAYLRDSGETIDHIAKLCGFSKEDSLAETFEQTIGVSPDEWRTRNRH